VKRKAPFLASPVWKAPDMVLCKSFPLLALVPLAAALIPGASSLAQTPDRITHAFDPAQMQLLANHHPSWAIPANDTGPLPLDQPLENMTFVLARSSEQQRAFEQFLQDQQNPSSPEFHHWLTSTEVGERFGLSDDDIAAISAWIQSQGLHVKWVAPSRIFIGFGGTAADMGRAFQTQFHAYRVGGKQRISVSSDPSIPVALAPVIQAIRGMYTIEARPLHNASPMISNQPGLTITGNGQTVHFMAPTDFATIYDLPTTLTGAGLTIGIVGESRTDFADFTNFRQMTGTTFPNPTEVIPTGFGGVDPGPAFTTVPSCESTDNCSASTISLLDAQGEATLDVMRSGSVAAGAALLLVTATAASGGIEDDAQYLVQTSPTPAQVLSISFGACESEGGQAGVEYWNSLFQQAVGEGISVFVSSGDSGASGCDIAFTTPPADPEPNSPNYLCSSSYATCVGGTEFNDTANPSQYWNASNNSTLGSVISYIPEGAWNEPFNSSNETQVAATGGGVSVYIATPTWQTGSGVPSARLGRYTPDLAFSAAAHDGYFGCFAAGEGTCIAGSSGTPFIVFSGTSAAAPSMAGVAALLDQEQGSAQGDINSETYTLSANNSAVFRQVSVVSSGVSSCAASTPSICNNSISSPSGLTGGQAGFVLGSSGGYSEATGLGSLDVSQFINNYSSTFSKITPNVTISVPPSSITTAESVLVLVTVNGGSGNPAPAGSVTLTSGAYSSGQALLNDPSSSSNTVTISIGAGLLAVGTDTLTATYTSSAAGYNNATGTNTITVIAAGNKTTPTITWATPAAITYGTPLSSSQLDAAANVAGTFSYSPAAGTVLTAGPQVLTVSFTPNDTTDYTTATGTVTLTVNKATPAVTWANPAAITYGTALSSTQLDASASVPGSFAYSPGVGTVLLAGQQSLDVTFTPNDANDYNNANGSVALTVNKATPVVTWPTPAAVTVGATLSSTQLDASASVPGTFAYSPAAGTILTAVGNTNLSVTFTPTDATDYSVTTATVTLVVNAIANPSFAVSGTSVSLAPGASSGNISTVTVTPSGGFTGSVNLTAAITLSPSGAQDLPILSFGSTSPVTISGSNAATGTLTITTTAATANLQRPESPFGRWRTAGGAALACVLFFCVPSRNRAWYRLLAVFVPLAILFGGLSACGGNPSSSGGGGNSGTGNSSGTTAGSYTITVTATSGSTSTTTTIDLTVT
jgi:hypothetical protein